MNKLIILLVMTIAACGQQYDIKQTGNEAPKPVETSPQDQPSPQDSSETDSEPKTESDAAKTEEDQPISEPTKDQGSSAPTANNLKPADNGRPAEKNEATGTEQPKSAGIGDKIPSDAANQQEGKQEDNRQEQPVPEQKAELVETSKVRDAQQPRTNEAKASQSAEKFVKHRQEFEIKAERKKIDVLVVIDNSKSMNYEQKSMATRFRSFLQEIKEADWRLAITTTDVVGQGPLKDGRLVPMHTDKGLRYFLESSDDLTWAEEIFAKTIQRPASEGTAFEQGLAATYRSLQRITDKSKFSTANKEFHRTDAALNVILVSDSDETPHRKEKWVANSPLGLMNLVKRIWQGKKTFVFHIIAVRANPLDKECRHDKQAVNEAYAVKYEEMRALTGGISGSVCELDYGMQLKQIGESAFTTAGNIPSLDFDPADVDGDGHPDVYLMDGQGGRRLVDSIDGRRASITNLAAGKYAIEYHRKVTGSKASK